MTVLPNQARRSRVRSGPWLAIFLALVMLLAPLAARAGVFNPETFTLANGMRVVVVENHRVPVVTHMVWYKVGAADEPLGKSGLAHYFEHLMFKGTERFGPGVFSSKVARNGGRENAFTSQDYTGYYQTIARDRLEMVMELEADRMTGLALTAEVIEPERLVILEERRSRVDNNPAALLRERVGAALYANYPYRIPIIGWAEEIKDLSLDDLQRFYKRWYAPNNAILVVTGAITAAELKPLAEKYYGVIPRADVPERARPPEPEHIASVTVTLRDARVRQASWSRTWIAPSAVFGATEHAEPLEVLAEILGGGATSRLYKSLVVDKKIAVGAGAAYDAANMGPSALTVYAAPAPGVSLDEIEAAIEAEIQTLLADGATADEVARATGRMQAQAIYANDSLSGGGWVLGSALASGLTIDYVETWPERIGAVTVDAVNAAATHVIRGRNGVTARLLSADKGAS